MYTAKILIQTAKITPTPSDIHTVNLHIKFAYIVEFICCKKDLLLINGLNIIVSPTHMLHNLHLIYCI